MILNNILSFLRSEEKQKKYYGVVPAECSALCNEILRAPHTLIGGTTGSGKSVLLNAIMYEYLHNYGVDNRIILIDPKRVELSVYKDLPHTYAYTSDPERACRLLDDVIETIDRRYSAMEQAHTRHCADGHIHIIIDELADMMISQCSRNFKLRLQKILQIGRACNVHVIAATQAPNRQIIPANLVLNFTNRVALRCLSAIESRQIVNIGGAETLPRYGQGLYLSPGRGVTLVTIPMFDESRIENAIYEWTDGMFVVR